MRRAPAAVPDDAEDLHPVERNENLGRSFDRSVELSVHIQDNRKELKWALAVQWRGKITDIESQQILQVSSGFIKEWTEDMSSKVLGGLRLRQ